MLVGVGSYTASVPILHSSSTSAVAVAVSRLCRQFRTELVEWYRLEVVSAMVAG